MAVHSIVVPFKVKINNHDVLRITNKEDDSCISSIQFVVIAESIRDVSNKERGGVNGRSFAAPDSIRLSTRRRRVVRFPLLLARLEITTRDVRQEIKVH